MRAKIARKPRQGCRNVLVRDGVPSGDLHSAWHCFLSTVPVCSVCSPELMLHPEWWVVEPAEWSHHMAQRCWLCLNPSPGSVTVQDSCEYTKAFPISERRTHITLSLMSCCEHTPCSELWFKLTEASKFVLKSNHLPFIVLRNCVPSVCLPPSCKASTIPTSFPGMWILKGKNSLQWRQPTRNCDMHSTIFWVRLRHLWHFEIFCFLLVEDRVSGWKYWVPSSIQIVACPWSLLLVLLSICKCHRYGRSKCRK